MVFDHRVETDPSLAQKRDVGAQLRALAQLDVRADDAVVAYGHPVARADSGVPAGPSAFAELLLQRLRRAPAQLAGRVASWGGWPDVFRLSCFAMGWLSPFLIASPVLPQDRDRSCHAASHQPKINSVRDIPILFSQRSYQPNDRDRRSPPGSGLKIKVLVRELNATKPPAVNIPMPK